jgi:acetolactate synthase-1/3 small subunit
MRRILSISMENEPGALSRVVGLFSQRWYNIETITCAPSDQEGRSRLTITTRGDERVIEQITKQLNKLIDTYKVVDLTENRHIERELMLLKVIAPASRRDEIHRCVQIFRGDIVNVTNTTYTVQLAGDSAKIEAFVDAMREHGIVEMARSGVVGLPRDKTTTGGK